MKQCFKEYYFKWPIAILLMVLLSPLLGCKSENNHSAFNNQFRYPENLILNSFNNYIQTISSPDFPLASFKTHTDLYKTPVYTQKIQSDNNVQLFPAILWQIYALNGETKWKHLAENYSVVLDQDHFVEKRNDVGMIPYVYLTRYLADQNQTYKSSLLTILSQYISKNEINQELSGDLDTKGKVCIERLLENELLFFASKETGDPVYAQLAQQHSEYIFEHYFQNSHFNELYYDLANCKTIPATNELDALNSEGLYHLAVIFYGFTILDNQKENERYHLLCVRLADLFSSIFNDIPPGGTSTKRPEGLIEQKMDILSKTLVCLSLNKLHDRTDNDYQEIAEKIFNQILNTLNQPDEKKNEQHSSRLYYYLFELLKQNP